jgi:uncharacterized FlaG/YvyC family protein
MKVGEIPAMIPRAAGENLYASGGQAAAPTPSQRRELSEIQTAVRELNLPELQVPNRGLTIIFDREVGQSLVQIVDRDSGEVIQQIPGQEVIERVRYYRQLQLADVGYESQPARR